MAEVVSEEHGPPKPVSSAEETFFRHRQREQVVNQRRFGLAYLALAIGVGVAVGLGIVLIGRGTTHHARPGAAGFSPGRQGELGARDIAAHVQHEYRLADGRDLVGIIGQRPSFQNIAMHDELIRPSDQQTSKDIQVLPVGNGIMFVMCGLGQNCSMDTGTYTQPRQLLLEQEALELALRTFKNDGSVQTITTLFPPSSPQPNAQVLAAVFLRKQVAPLLSRTLSASIPRPAPYKAGDIDAAMAERLKLFVDPSLYLYKPDVLGDGTPTLILDPFPHGP
jgi:hypothetical protein